MFRGGGNYNLCIITMYVYIIDFSVFPSKTVVNGLTIMIEILEKLLSVA